LGGNPDFSAVSSELSRRGPPHTNSAREDPPIPGESVFRREFQT
jgi:hypothetical protein